MVDQPEWTAQNKGKKPKAQGPVAPTPKGKEVSELEVVIGTFESSLREQRAELATEERKIEAANTTIQNNNSWLKSTTYKDVSSHITAIDATLEENTLQRGGGKTAKALDAAGSAAQNIPGLGGFLKKRAAEKAAKDAQEVIAFDSTPQNQEFTRHLQAIVGANPTGTLDKTTREALLKRYDEIHPNANSDKAAKKEREDFIKLLDGKPPRIKESVIEEIRDSYALQNKELLETGEKKKAEIKTAEKDKQVAEARRDAIFKDISEDENELSKKKLELQNIKSSPPQKPAGKGKRGGPSDDGLAELVPEDILNGMKFAVADVGDTLRSNKPGGKGSNRELG